MAAFGMRLEIEQPDDVGCGERAAHALALWLRMICSENRCPLFRIMR
jgi:hypothetical protein